MNGQVQIVHAWAAAVCFTAAVLGIGSMAGSLAFPVLSPAGRRLFATGVVTAIIAVLTYVMYLAGMAIAVVVRLS